MTKTPFHFQRPKCAAIDLQDVTGDRRGVLGNQR
jgi:hypothetical protein